MFSCIKNMMNYLGLTSYLIAGREIIVEIFSSEYIGEIDMVNKKIYKNIFFQKTPLHLMQTLMCWKNKKYIYKKDGVIFFNNNQVNTEITPVVLSIKIKMNNIWIDIFDSVEKYDGKNYLWVILQNENITGDKLKIQFINDSIKEIEIDVKNNDTMSLNELITQ